MNNNPEISIIIPVYKSSSVIGKTLKAVIAVLKEMKVSYEVLLINDGSPDNSWIVIEQLAKENKHVTSINLFKNYGQHTAVLCGINRAKGNYLITMDDDMQNPPGEIPKLYGKILEGYDLVFAKFHQKKHSLFRRMGSKLVNYFNREIFNKPDDITLTNFRIFSQNVAQLLGEYKTNYPYIPGLLLMHASKIANVYTEHHSREDGKSNYSLLKIIALLSRLLINYSSYPLKMLSIFGFIISLLSFFIGAFYLFKSIFIGSSVPGWTSTILLISFFNGILILLLGTMSIYISRTLSELSEKRAYMIKEIVNE